MKTFFKHLKMAVAVATIAVGINTQASAAALPFTVDPSNLFGPGYAGAFQADFISGSSSTRVLLDINADNSNVSSGTGWIYFTGFSNNGVPLTTGTTGVGTQYDLWAEFTYTLQHDSGPYAAPGSTNTVTSITFDIWVDPNQGGSTFNSAPTDGTADPSVAHSATAVQLSTSSFVYDGVADINALGGTGFNSTLDFTLINPDGPAFFTAPVPFHNLTFNEFNNTSQGVFGSLTDGFLVIQNTSGGIDFNNQIPEPATLALLAVGLLGVAASTRRRRI